MAKKRDFYSDQVSNRKCLGANVTRNRCDEIKLKCQKCKFLVCVIFSDISRVSIDWWPKKIKPNGNGIFESATTHIKYCSAKKPRLLTYLTTENTEAWMRLTKQTENNHIEEASTTKNKNLEIFEACVLFYFFPIRNSYWMGNSQDVITRFNATVDAHTTHSRSTLISDVNWFWCAITRVFFWPVIHTCFGWLLLVLIKSIIIFFCLSN